MIRTIAIVTLFIAFVQAKNTTFTSCSPNGKIINVDLEPCDTTPCEIQSGKVVKFSGSFENHIAESSPLYSTEAKIGDRWVTYPGISSNGCNFFPCPLEANVVYPYNISLEIVKLPITIDTELRFKLLSNDGSTLLACGITPVKVIAA